jgi:hypothetical protein
VWQQIKFPGVLLHDVSCLDLVATTIDLSIGSDVQDQLGDLSRNQKMTHAGMLVQCH